MLKITCPSGDVFVVFDSHPRRKHSSGAGFIFNSSLQSTALYLSDLLKYDPGLLEDSSLQWQAQLLAHYSAHLFISNDNFRSLPDLTEAVLDSSLTVLNLKAEVAGLKSQNQLLENENKRLEEDVSKLEGDVADLKSVMRKDKGKDTQRHIIKTPTAEDAWKTRHHTTATTTSSPLNVQSINRTQSRTGGAIYYRDGSPVQDSAELDLFLAMEAQREYDQEHAILHAQERSLRSEEPKTFHCGICLSDENEHMVARFDPCNHPFCRDCVRDYIRSKVGEGRFPILCPICAAEREQGNPGSTCSRFSKMGSR